MNRHELAEECVLIEEAGESVREYLASCGCISPWGTWYRLQKEELHRKDWQITDGRGGKRMGSKLTLEQKKKAVEIAIDGGNQLKYLKSIGLSNPSASWILIRKKLKTADPEKYAQLPDRANAKQKDEKRLKDAAEETVHEISKRLKSQEDELEDDFMIYGLKTKIGDFQAADGRLCWYKTAQEMVSMPVEDWKNLMEVVPKVLNVMRM